MSELTDLVEIEDYFARRLETLRPLLDDIDLTNCEMDVKIWAREKYWTVKVPMNPEDQRHFMDLIVALQQIVSQRRAETRTKIKELLDGLH